MSGKVGRRQRHAALGQIGRRGGDNEAKRPEPARHQPRICQFAAADDHIEAGFDDIDQMVVEVQIQLHLGIAGLEFGQHGQQKTVADGGQAHAQPAAWRLGSSLHGRACIVQLVEDAPAALVKQSPFLRQTHLACGAMEQAQAQLLLQACHVLAHGRGRDAKRAAGLGKAQKIGGTYKGLKSAEAVHGDWQPLVGIVRSFTAIFV